MTFQRQRPVHNPASPSCPAEAGVVDPGNTASRCTTRRIRPALTSIRRRGWRMPGECAECNGPAAVHGWAPVELCFPCVIELRGRPTQADLAAAEQAATVTRDAQWRE